MDGWRDWDGGKYDDEALFGEVDAEDEDLGWVSCDFWGDEDEAGIPLLLERGFFELMPLIDVDLYGTFFACESARVRVILTHGKSSARGTSFESIGDVSTSVTVIHHSAIKPFNLVDDTRHGQPTASRHFAPAHTDSIVPFPCAKFVCG